MSDDQKTPLPAVLGHVLQPYNAFERGGSIRIEYDVRCNGRHFFWNGIHVGTYHDCDPVSALWAIDMNVYIESKMPQKLTDSRLWC